MDLRWGDESWSHMMPSGHAEDGELDFGWVHLGVGQ